MSGDRRNISREATVQTAVRGELGSIDSARAEFTNSSRIMEGCALQDPPPLWAEMEGREPSGMNFSSWPICPRPVDLPMSILKGAKGQAGKCQAGSFDSLGSNKKRRCT